jgi:hypothetical protein
LSSNEPNDTQLRVAFEPYDAFASVFSPGVFGDRRLQNRAARIWEDAAALFSGVGNGEPVKSTRAVRRGAQRLYANNRVDTALAFREGAQFTLNLTAGMTRVIAMHDSSEFDLTGRFEPPDAGPLRSSNARGYMLHSVVLVDPVERMPRGFVYANIWTRSWDLKHNDQSRPPHRKESYKWKRGLKRLLLTCPEARSWVHVMDREGDLYENFEFAVAEKLSVIIGARSDKRIAEGSGWLWSFMRHQPVRERRTVQMTSSATGKKERRTLTIRAASVTLTPVKKYPWQHKRRPLEVNVVYVRSEDAGQEWMLITTCSVDDTTIWQVFDDYGVRTIGEDGFKLLKTGLQIESETIQDVPAFKRKMALLLPLATCLLDWQFRARAKPNTPAADHVAPETLEALRVVAQWHRLDMPRGRWTIADVVECLARIGGYERRAGGRPGWITIWRGWRVFEQIRQVRELALQEHRRERA